MAKQIYIRLEDEIEEKIRIEADKRGHSVASVARELIVLGLKLKEHQEAKDGNKVNNDADENLNKELDKAVIENLYLSRFLVSKLIKTNEGGSENFLKQAREKAQEFINKDWSDVST